MDDTSCFPAVGIGLDTRKSLPVKFKLTSSYI